MIEWDNVYETLNRMHCSWEAFLKCEVLLLWLLVNEGSRLWFWRVLWNSQPWSAVHLQLASNLVSQNIVGKNLPQAKRKPTKSSICEFRRQKEHRSKRWTQHHLPSPPGKWGLCVFCKVLNPWVNWSPTLNYHEPQGWEFLGLGTNRNRSSWMFRGERGLENGAASVARKQETESTCRASGQWKQWASEMAEKDGFTYWET